MTRWWALLTLLTLLSCGGTRNARALDPKALVEAMWAQPAHFALQARYKIKIVGPEVNAVTTGALVMHQPDRVRVEIQSPLRTPLLYLVSDGKALHAWSARGNTFYRGDDAVAVLRQLTGGSMGVADVLAVMTGRLPMAGAELLDLQRDSDGNVITVLQGPDGLRVRAVVETRTRMVRELLVTSAPPEGSGPRALGEIVLDVRYPDLMNFQNGKMPEEIEVRLPTVGWDVFITVHTWDELGVIPDAFDLPAPPGSVERDMVVVLKKLAEKQGVRQTP
jgi:outer membrane biogenesis lipoprotein LolB